MLNETNKMQCLYFDLKCYIGNKINTYTKLFFENISKNDRILTDL